MPERENLVLAFLRDMRGEMADMRGDMADMRQNMASKSDIAELRSEMHSEMHSLRADVASDLMLEKRLSEQVVGLRRAVVEYHSSAVGHGMLISELEERMRRVEKHLNLPPIEPH